MDISQYTEMDVRSKIINLSIAAAGWAPEYYFTPGRIKVRARLATRDKGKRSLGLAG